MHWTRIVGGVGRTLVGTGTLLLLFVAYQLWGTGIHERRSQNRLEDQFTAALATTTTTTTTRSSGTGSTTSTAVVEAPPPPIEGDAVAQIRIPSIGVSRYVVEGVKVADLKKGPGHYPLTPLPGQVGNAAIAGHRTTYGAPFFELNEVEVGDMIEVTTLQGEFTYIVDGKQVVRPEQVEVLAQTEEARLTLTTCEPRYSARRRLIITALLTEEQEPAPAPPTTTTTTTVGSDDEPAPAPEPPTLDVGGLSGDPAARGPTFWWGLWTTLAGIIIWRIAKRFSPLIVYPLGAPIFLVLLFVFFENVSRLLPANI